MYCRDEAFREVKYVMKQEFLPGQKELEKIEFELKDDELDSTK